MSRKSKGSNAERDLIHKFWSTQSWCAIRAAGSGSQRYASPDILAGNGLRRVALECKSSKELKKYLEKDEVEQLANFSKKFGAEPYIALRFNKQEWYFLSLDDLDRTKNNYVVDLDLAKKKGMVFEELIKS